MISDLTDREDDERVDKALKAFDEALDLLCGDEPAYSMLCSVFQHFLRHVAVSFTSDAKLYLTIRPYDAYAVIPFHHVIEDTLPYCSSSDPRDEAGDRRLRHAAAQALRAGADRLDPRE